MEKFNFKLAKEILRDDFYVYIAKMYLDYYRKDDEKFIKWFDAITHKKSPTNK